MRTGLVILYAYTILCIGLSLLFDVPDAPKAEAIFGEKAAIAVEAPRPSHSPRRSGDTETLPGVLYGLSAVWMLGYGVGFATFYSRLQASRTGLARRH
jgi:hypothetical protein